MVEIFGKVKRSEILNGQQEVVYRVPAFSERIARRRAAINSRIKGFEDFEIVSVRNVGSGNIPGQKLFDIATTIPR